MSLRAFHIVFVTLAVILSFMVGTWGLRQETTGYFLVGVFSLVLGVALIGYGFWFYRKIRTGRF